MFLTHYSMHIFVDVVVLTNTLNVQTENAHANKACLSKGSRGQKTVESEDDR